MGGLLIVDTSVLVAAERQGLPPHALQKTAPGARLAVSAVTVAELLHGYFCARPKSRRVARAKFLDALLGEFDILPVDLPVAREHGRIWADLAERGESIGPYDLIIAATALAHRVPLATLNDREFRKVKGLEVRALRAYDNP